MNLATVLKLTRISAWPTLLSNVLAAWWLAGCDSEKAAPAGLLLLLFVTASCFYLAGMVLNDFFDARLDAVERPERPIPSGEIPAAEAGFLGFFLLFCGLSGTEFCAASTGSELLRYTGRVLAAMIVGYDVLFKRFPLIGPFAMGYCRFLNILFIIVAVNAVIFWPDHHVPYTWEDELTLLSWPLFYAFGIMAYIVGVTIVSGFEAGLPDDEPLNIRCRISVWCGVGFSLLGLFFLFAPILGSMVTENFSLHLSFKPLSDVVVSKEPVFSDPPWNKYLTFLFAALPFVLLWKPVQGILQQPVSATVRHYVGSALALIIPIDAVCCLVYVGLVPALSILCLLPLTMLLRRIVPMS